MAVEKAVCFNIVRRRAMLKVLENKRNAAIQEMNDAKDIKANIKDTKQSLSIQISEEGIILLCRAQQINLTDAEARAFLEELKILYGAT
jgi:hypothetical protein